MKKHNGHKPFEEQVIARFEEHDRRFEAMQQSIAELTMKLLGAIGDLRTELIGRLDQTNASLDQTNGRLDQVIVNTGRHWRDLERRVTAIEERLDPP